VGPTTGEAGSDTFEAMYTALFTRALRTAQAVLRNTAASEDVAAETLARAYARWSNIAGFAPAWVTRVAANLALDNLRRKQVIVADRVTQGEGSLDRLVLELQLAKLPRRQREVLVLRFLLDLSEAETADLLRITVDTVHTHVKRGLARLRGDLAANLLSEKELR
jgi:RNA polymerase sigma factor (sigma-70 family)